MESHGIGFVFAATATVVAGVLMEDKSNKAASFLLLLGEAAAFLIGTIALSSYAYNALKKSAATSKRAPASEHAALKWGSDKLAEGYANMTECFPQHENIYRYTMLKHLGPFLKDKTVLDMPCGEGRFAADMLRLGARSVLCVDIAPKMCELTEKRLVGLHLISSDDMSHDSFSAHKKLNTCVANACELIPEDLIPGASCDCVCASFIFEYSTNRAELEMTARNLFNAAKPGAPLCVIYVPGAKNKSDIAVVKEVMGIEATELTPDIKPGDPVIVSYLSEHSEPFSYTIRYWHTDDVVNALLKAGFVDVEVKRLELNPAYDANSHPGKFDLARFIKHTGNRQIVGRKPL